MSTNGSSLDCYLAGESSEARLDYLRSLATSGSGLAPGVVVALLRFELPAAEKLALLEAVSTSDPDAFEDFVFDHMIHWPQDVAAKALRLWAGSPSRSRWADLVRLASLPGLPQRVLYTMLDVSAKSPDSRLLQAIVDESSRSGQDEWSPAFKALLFMRMVQRGLSSDVMLDLARKTCVKAMSELVPEDKSALAAWVFLWRFDPAGFERLRSSITTGSPQSMLHLLPGDRSLDWMRIDDQPARRPTARATKAKSHATHDDHGAGACLAWLLSRDVSASTVRTKVSGVWRDIVAIGDVDEPDDRWSAATNSLRAKKGIYRIACIRALGKRRGSDLAVLKLLDFVRSGDARELMEVTRALGGVASPRAVQELVSMISRPNAAAELQLEIAAILKGQNISGHIDAINAASSHLAIQVRNARRAGVPAEALVEVWEALTDLATCHTGTGGVAGDAVAVQARAIQDADERTMDNALSKSIPHYETLSAEVKRALRTAWYFHQQTGSGPAASAIDLSPVIDMQYKAMELLFREYFEDICGRLIQQGVIQRKLDLIGYSRPIPEKMDEFENFIAGLPVIKAIPFFSKFKLRKMLLALCQFKPGKRFTLDGLKAFGLFFLVFGRQECRFGLGGIVPAVPGAFKDEAALAGFCSLLHVFQDFRNRAAHEGFHPDAAADIKGIWRNTAEIVQVAHGLRRILSGNSSEPGLVRGRAS
jgi:hypothetical protein